jgi:uncharacterized membrane protein
MWYLILKLLHVLAAIVAVGSNMTYGVWIVSGSRNPSSLPFALQGIKRIDDRLANPAYGLLLVTGVAMILPGRIRITTPWLLVALVLYVAMILLGAFGYTPTLKKQISLLSAEGAGSRSYTGVARRGTWLGILLGVLAILILFLMVVKPAL